MLAPILAASPAEHLCAKADLCVCCFGLSLSGLAAGLCSVRLALCGRRSVRLGALACCRIHHRHLHGRAKSLKEALKRETLEEDERAAAAQLEAHSCLCASMFAGCGRWHDRDMQQGAHAGRVKGSASLASQHRSLPFAGTVLVEPHLHRVLFGCLKHGLRLLHGKQAAGVCPEVHARFPRLAVRRQRLVDACGQPAAVRTVRHPPAWLPALHGRAAHLCRPHQQDCRCPSEPYPLVHFLCLHAQACSPLSGSTQQHRVQATVYQQEALGLLLRDDVTPVNAANLTS